MSISDEMHSSSDEDNKFVDPRAHKKLLQNVRNLSKTQNIQKPSRSEPALAKDEFHLVKSRSRPFEIRNTSVSVGDVVKTLNKLNRNLTVSKELKNTQRNKKVLRKPLERPAAERIQRSIGYENVKKNLSKWDAVVATNRSSDFQVFPLKYEKIHVDLNSVKKKKNFSVKSELMLEMEAIEQKLKGFKDVKQKTLTKEDNEKQKIQQKLTKNELISRRKELAYMRMRESQKSAKARLHNKIKSKKFHKLQKKEKLKEQLKEFEILQKSNPEAALVKLEQLERHRIEERAQLRHKNTGTWAKNLQVRAKYDKEVRKDLAEQLAISRELTQKAKTSDDDDNNDYDSDNVSETVDNVENEVDPFNPWIKLCQKDLKKNDSEENGIGYRKYWIEKNANEEKLKEFKMYSIDEQVKESSKKIEINSDPNFKKEVEINFQNSENNGIKGKKRQKTKNESQQDISAVYKNNICITDTKNEKKDNLRYKSIITDGWLVEEIDGNRKTNEIDDLFNEAEDIIQQKVKKKLEKLSTSLQSDKSIKKRQYYQKDELKNLRKLTFKQQQNKPAFDEELMETTDNLPQDQPEIAERKLKTLERIEQNRIEIENDIIDPNKFANIKPKTLQTTLPELIANGEFLDDDVDFEAEKQIAIAEAFEDDDIVADFNKEKNNDNKNEELDLSMPGWGSWAGCGINQNVQRKKRFVLKFPKAEKRRDENKTNIYINESAANKKLKEHLVSDLPFPFTSVKDYESSIRQPIGREFVPETAFRMLTRPSVVTKLGKIIEPMDESVLIEKNKRPRHEIDARIEEMLEGNK